MAEPVLSQLGTVHFAIVAIAGRVIGIAVERVVGDQAIGQEVLRRGVAANSQRPGA